MKIGALLLCFIFVPAVLLAGCSGLPLGGQAVSTERAEVPAVEAPVREAPAAADPGRAVREIYKAIGNSISETIGEERLVEIIGITSLRTREIFARYSDPRGGLADVIIIRPEAGGMIEIREALYRYRDRRVTEFEHFDVLGSLEIAQSAVIFEYGDYVVLLMTSDNDGAQLIISQYMPL